ncbi:MAG: bifunctional phosphoribosylaminoimidazolecarboxamide formyltransferase/IMP cyclohydrolase, partial [Anaerolineales bacterium]|nr:bifunctional phosphoribosylaminoimidazolecarboxamide formyltransferase/IMP cyclohydrolase [Anaerolineales bacterium]
MPTALFSLSDKTGLITFARGLIESGWDLLASGGTARALREADLAVIDIAEYTNSPEILGGRVKTLHPAVHGGILARATDEDAAQLGEIRAKYIDLVACSLYPFEQTIGKRDVTLADAIENIDIGGVTLIRAAAKNHARVTVVTDAADFPEILHEIQTHGGTSLKMRARLAVKAFAHTADYDAAITKYLSEQLTYDTGHLTPQENHPLRLTLYPIQTLRYGENWHQSAEIYGYTPNAGPMGGHLLQGKPLSYNNMLDLDAAWRAAVSFERPSVVIVKHLSPCGVACGDTLGDAYPRAFASDPISAFGGVVAVNRPFDAGIANQLGDLFLECIAAPGFTPEAMDILSKKKNLRLLTMPDTTVEPEHELRSITRGFVRQSIDFGDPVETTWKVVTERQPTPEEWQAMQFAWIACQHVKSNSIVFAVGEATVGIGGGQPNRVDCVKIAAE